MKLSIDKLVLNARSNMMTTFLPFPRTQYHEWAVLKSIGLKS